MTTTKSPPSTCGANVGLCLPRSRVAIWTASRPSTTSVASITCHSRVTSAGFGLYVRTVVDLRFSEVDKTDTDVGERPAIPQLLPGTGLETHNDSPEYRRGSLWVK